MVANRLKCDSKTVTEIVIWIYFFYRYTSPPSAESTSSSTISQKVDSSTSATSSEAPREARPSRFNPGHPEQPQMDHQPQGHCVLAAETPLVSSSLAASLGNLSKSRYYI